MSVAIRPAPPAPATGREVTVVVPTYREVESLPYLLDRLAGVRAASGLSLHVLIMDDDSRDGTEALVERLALPWVTLVVRKTDRGLSAAVLDGLRRATGEMVVVMDADLSHPPEVIPRLIEALDGGAEIAVGSRYVDGGSTADDWGVLRWLNSRIASLLARPLTRLRDPMAGFFALRRSTFEAGTDWNPVGYKILLECVVKCGCRKVAEVPIHFVDRAHGESKLSLREQLLYLKHLRRLYTHRLGTWSHLVQFLAVGASGVLVNLALLTAFLHVGLDRRAAVALAIALSMVWNFELNRRLSFSYARGGSIVRQFLGFVAACSVGGVVNYAVSLAVWELASTPQLAALAGVLAGTAFNFVFSRFLVFRAKQPR